MAFASFTAGMTDTIIERETDKNKRIFLKKCLIFGALCAKIHWTLKKNGPLPQPARRCSGISLRYERSEFEGGHNYGSHEGSDQPVHEAGAA